MGGDSYDASRIKSCKTCGNDKPCSEFHRDDKGRYGVRSRCKACCKETKNAKKVDRRDVELADQMYHALLEVLQVNCKVDAISRLEHLKKRTCLQSMDMHGGSGLETCNGCNCKIALIAFKQAKTVAKDSKSLGLLCGGCFAHYRPEEEYHEVCVRMIEDINALLQFVQLDDLPVQSDHSAVLLKAQNVQPHAQQIPLPSPFSEKISWQQLLEEIPAASWKEKVRKVGQKHKRSAPKDPALEVKLKHAVKTGYYLQINFDGATEGEMGPLRSLYHREFGSLPASPFKRAMASTTDLQNLGLLLIGNKGTTTGVHRDWTEARNIAFAMGSAKREAALALWAFCPVGKEEALADAQVKILGPKKSFGRHAGLTASDLYKLEAGFVDEGQTVLRLVHQFHGSMVIVPPGWVHSVVNLQECCKLAWDFFEMPNIPAYLQFASSAGKYFGKDNGEDWMGLGPLVVQTCINLLPK